MPFQVLIGGNASGKSNVLEALRFLSAAVSADTLYDAVDAVRGDAEALFGVGGDGTRCETFTIAVELLVDMRTLRGQAQQSRVVRQDPSATPDAAEESQAGARWRYELRVGWGGPQQQPELAVLGEDLRPLQESEETWPGLREASAEWLAARVRYQEQGVRTALSPVGWSDLEGSVDYFAGGGFSFALHPTNWALPSTAFRFSSHQAGEPARRIHDELLALRLLHLSDAALRQFSLRRGRTELLPDGTGLPAYLARLHRTTATEDDPQGVLADIRADFVRLVREVSDFEVITDEWRRDTRIELRDRQGAYFDADTASEGTLRVLALLAAVHDPDGGGLLAVEEPENGVFPERLRDLLRTRRSLTTDPQHDAPEAPLAQLLLTSHSPVVLEVAEPAEVALLSSVSRITSGQSEQVTQVRHLSAPGDSATRDSAGVPLVTEMEIKRFRQGAA